MRREKEGKREMGMKKQRSLYYSILLLLITLHLASASSPDEGVDHMASRTHKEEQPEIHCSRERSRAAWKIIEEYLMPFVEREKYQLFKSMQTPSKQ